MLILSLDTTTRAGSAALVRDDRVVAVLDGDATRTHGERLPGELDRVLAAAGVALHDVDLLAVASGPGAFTGLRIGLAAMQGVAMAANRPVIGVSALDAMALAAFDQMRVDSARVGCWMDAARGEVFAALYDVQRATESDAASEGPIRLTAIAGPVAAPPAQVWASWGSLLVAEVAVTGDGALRYASVLGPNVRILPPSALAPAIARLALRAARAGGSHAPHQLQPLYVRRPDVGSR